MEENAVKRIYLASKSDWERVDPHDPLPEALTASLQCRSDVVRVDSPDEADLILACEEYSTKGQGHGRELLKDEFLQKYFHKLYVVNHDDIGRGHLPGVHVSLTSQLYDSRFHRNGLYLWTYNECTASGPKTHEPSILFSFRGSLGSARVRERLYRSLSQHPDGKITAVNQHFHTHSVDQKQLYVEEIIDSHFVLCPRGCSPATYRLFETMSLARCPVIISDAWMALAGVQWDKCSIRVRERDIEKIPAILNERRGESFVLGQNARTAWEKNFSPSSRGNYILGLILALDESRDPETRKIDFHSRRWNSLRYHWANSWTSTQRLARLPGRLKMHLGRSIGKFREQ